MRQYENAQVQNRVQQIRGGRIVDLRAKGVIAEETIRTIGAIFPLPIDTTLDKMIYGAREQVSAHPDARIIADAAHAVVWNKIADAIRYDTRPLD